MKEVVSIIVPVYNVGTYLRKCLSSIQKQTYANLEVILVNDGSTDNSREICEQFCITDHRFMLVDEPNLGLSAARNHGLKKAHGEYVYFVDSDDWLDYNLVLEVLSLFERFETKVVAFSYYEVYSNQKVESAYVNPKLGKVNSVEALLHLFKGSFGSYVWRFIAKRELYTQNEITFPQGRNFEDVATTYQVFGAAGLLYFSAKRLYFYNQRSTSITHVHDAKDIDDMLKTLVEMDNYIEHNFKAVLPELRKLQFNLIFMLLIRMHGWKTISKNKIPRPRSASSQSIEKLVAVLEQLHRKTAKKDMGYMRQRIKLSALKYHLFPVLLHVKKYAHVFWGRK
ncbi:glycosyltransferase family 2 protein [Liquorilactobacillus satsumensis]|uniref:glycosyltransferase family 2 protein n=1 Tax=Liquorilactobacillus satsumensis TaxID=259059 RepID=UPI001E5CCBD8|nr:glycosyltransferase family 2 protein [Liquorilactobacillus satsumensis]MCP9358230.1 glycosyltransferase family 2 protein [Liquorilactobacillus satsumensis]MCP9372184.1 glycosyltransferase family 2 protein [Liquorilactobacillus satsumensis]